MTRENRSGSWLGCCLRLMRSLCARDIFLLWHKSSKGSRRFHCMSWCERNPGTHYLGRYILFFWIRLVTRCCSLGYSLNWSCRRYVRHFSTLETSLSVVFRILGVVVSSCGCDVLPVCVVFSRCVFFCFSIFFPSWHWVVLEVSVLNDEYIDQGFWLGLFFVWLATASFGFGGYGSLGHLVLAWESRWTFPSWSLALNVF